MESKKTNLEEIAQRNLNDPHYVLALRELNSSERSVLRNKYYKNVQTCFCDLYSQLTLSQAEFQQRTISAINFANNWGAKQNITELKLTIMFSNTVISGKQMLNDNVMIKRAQSSAKRKLTLLNYKDKIKNTRVNAAKKRITSLIKKHKLSSLDIFGDQ